MEAIKQVDGQRHHPQPHLADETGHHDAHQQVGVGLEHRDVEHEESQRNYIIDVIDEQGRLLGEKRSDGTSQRKEATQENGKTY